MTDQERCGYTGKLRFDSKQAAQDELRRYAARKGSRRSHFCVFCDGYHLTKGTRGNRKGRG